MPSVYEDFPFSFSPSDGGFHAHDVTPADLLPDDAIGVSAEDYADLVEQRSGGKVIRVVDGAVAAVDPPASDPDPTEGIRAAQYVLAMRKRVGHDPILAAPDDAYPSIDFWSDGRSSADFIIRADDDRAMVIDTHEQTGAFKFFADGNIGTEVLGDLLQRFSAAESRLAALEGAVSGDWTDVTDDREVVTVYTNDTGRPIQVAIAGLVITSTDDRPGVFVRKPNTTLWLKVANSGHGSNAVNASFIVPAGYSYAARSNGVPSTGFTFVKWVELR